MRDMLCDGGLYNTKLIYMLSIIEYLHNFFTYNTIFKTITLVIMEKNQINYKEKGTLNSIKISKRTIDI